MALCLTARTGACTTGCERPALVRSMDTDIAKVDIDMFFSHVLWERDFKNTCYRYDDVLSSAALFLVLHDRCDPSDPHWCARAVNIAAFILVILVPKAATVIHNGQSTATYSNKMTTHV